VTVESRHGYELHADAVNALLRGATVRPLGSRGQFVVLLLLALFAAMLVYLIPDRARLRLGVLALLLVAYLAAAVYLYATQRILVITLYHVAALLVSYGLVRTLQRRWFS
jgi:CHASE2 domain-containing sensor protein